jgi:cell division protein FtsI (penicillin-binding protein 3)/stage V sporulation protein D (sporulation-specific penicillin-binding protein)
MSAKVRMLIACFGLSIFFTIFSYRLVYLQVVRHDEYTALAAEKHVNRVTSYADRGPILDVHGEVLADNEPIKTVIADGSLVNNAEALAGLLAAPLEMNRGKLEEMLTSGRRYIVIKKHVPESVANDLDAQMRHKSLKGIYFEQDSSRVYPNGPMLCHVLGFVDHTHQGMDGVEKSMDEYLRGHDGYRYTERDRTGKEIVLYRGQERAARAGCTVRLTIDMGLQNIVETELDAAMKQFKPKSAVVILMRPSTGEILALANRPNYDLNAINDAAPDDMKNRAIADMVEPGSTFKIVTVSAALNEKAVTPSTMVFCENGHYLYAGKVLRDHHGYGDLSVDDVIMKSSNIGAAKIAMMLGEQKFYEYIRSFGFGERTGVCMPGEISGLVHPPRLWSKISITRIPMGQGVGVTPLQTIAAMSAIANGGRLMMPQIVHDIVDENGATVASYPPVMIRHVVSPAVAGKVRDALKAVVSEHGTAVLARVCGFAVAGKTGTAQKPIPGGLGYYDNKYIASFEGFLPAENPQFSALVLIDEPRTGPEQYYGGLVAAPIFSRIAEKAARYLNLEPHPEDNPASGVILTQTRN